MHIKTCTAAIVFCFAQSVPGRAADIVWNSPKTLSSFDCRSGVGSDRIVITGLVKITHPDDADLRKPAKLITIICQNLKFEAGAKLQSDSSLDIRIQKTVSGPVFLESTRGKTGADPDATPGIWQQSVAAPGGPGGGGGNGSDGADCLKFGGGSDPGGTGGRGGRGIDGKNGEPGADGKPGSNGSKLRLVAGAFDKDVTIEAYSIGGEGGRGGLGGRGQDGGIGGPGGQGGAGGDSKGCHNASKGGNGGTGGDGGTGGNGGRGGIGGDGGRGGDINIGLKTGSEPPGLPLFNVDGGAGGFGGLGGQFGVGGLGGPGGAGGQGGRGSNVPLFTHDDGTNGYQGERGAKGDDGKVGPQGVTGKQGADGTFGGTKWGMMSDAEFNSNF